MAKFNTNSIKEHFTNYIKNNKEILFDKLGFCYFHNHKNSKLDEEDLETVSNLANEFNCKNDPIEVALLFFNEFANPKKWSRVSKEKDVWQSISEENCSDYSDVCGENNLNILRQLKNTDKIIIRTFGPKNEQLGDNYRLEFITLADDSDFVYWTIIVD